ncbi:unnamed protein product [Caenorhabditis bovis]|uniref:Uncharacterized protein n=1 Tax=Caenorhabditis bovis TaxID=2654633 RepID=A0A8S1EV60_9PELO|nr:unnamed protein product [Caenorhabditis bovis]
MILRALLHQRVRQFSSSPSEYDLVVIGGGSGGLSCSKTAATLGASVALIDAVAPTPSGVTWGIGGTCANVGCIPKKLMHHAAIVGNELKYADKYGWNGVRNARHDWSALVKIVNDRIKANNWIYRVQLNEKRVKYYNAFAQFIDSSTLRLTGCDAKKTQNILKAKNIVISTGLRPKYPKCHGKEHGITSDDLFSLPKPPGKTLVVGAGYVALETAGLLAGLGMEVELLIRSIPLKGFDRDCVNKIVNNLERHGVKIRWRQEVERVDIDNGKKLVQFTSTDRLATASNPIGTYDTVIWAMGREPNMASLDHKAAGIALSAKSGKILADEFDRTSTDGIYAIGDVVENRAELTPLAIQAGQFLANRLFANSKQIVQYEKVGTTVFTPLELSTVGLNEDDAIRLHGEDQIEVYHSYFTPFEFVVPQKPDAADCYVKLICLRNAPNTVLGLHFVGPNAAEVMQGFAVAFRKGITLDDVRHTIAIHPCAAEEFVKLTITKRSGLDPKVAGCCG